MNGNDFVLSPEQELEEQNRDDSSNEISNLSKKGYLYLKENRINEAIECFASILSVAENNNYALVGMGDANRKQGIFRNAAMFYQRCLIYHPGNNYALFGLADCYKALNQYHKAIEIWEQYLRHDDKNITVLTRIADAYRKVRDYNNSKLIYQKVLEMDPINPYAIIGMGHLLYDFKEYAGALSFWERMLKEDIKNVDIRVLTSIGNCHRKLKTFEKGITFFEMALEREKCNFYALFGLADCYRGMLKQNRSLEYWNRILEHDPRNKTILTRAGDAYKTLGEYDTALDYYQRALNIEFDIYAMMGLAVVDKLKGRYKEATDSLRRLIQQDPRSYRLYLELADCQLAKGNKKEALEALEEFQKHGIKNNTIIEMMEKLRAS